MWRVVTSAQPLPAKIAALHALHPPAPLLGAVVEQLAAQAG
jgi:hypothetical protein